MEKKKITVADLDNLLYPKSAVTYWQDGKPKPRREIFDNCEIICIENNRRPDPCIDVYVGDRIKG